MYLLLYLCNNARHNYRLFQPSEVRDANGNVTEVAYSAIGLVTQTWVRGKPGRNEGDTSTASVQMEYGLRAFYESKQTDPNNPQPVFVRTIRRIHHDTEVDVPLPKRDETIEAREYSDGFGRLLQTRTQGESTRFGDPLFGGGNGVLSPDQSIATNGTLITGRENNDLQTPNVVVSGWQRYDNKGRVIEKFEPFYDTGWEYQPTQEATQGRSIQMYYDPRGQVIRTVNPDGSEQHVIYGVPLDLNDPPLSPQETDKFTPTPWEAYTYDPNDNAGRTHANAEPHTRYPHHYNTPASIEIDPLGRTIRAVARHREGPLSVGSLPPIEARVTRSLYDIQGNLLTIQDALGRIAFEYVYDLVKRPLRTESIDAGHKVVVMDAAGNLVESRDAKGASMLHTYDALNRPSQLWARDGAATAMTLRQRLIYDRDPVDPAPTAGSDLAKNRNLLGKLVQHFDEAGVVTVVAYDFKGNIVDSTRQVLSDEFMLSNFRAQTGPSWVLTAPRVDWAAPAASLLDPIRYRTRSAFDALNRVKWSEYPQCANGEQYRLRPDYNRAGALERVDLEGPLNNGQGPRVPYVERIAYNAKGQRTLIVYGNGLMTRYAYDDQTFRLLRLRTDLLDNAPQPGPLTYKPKGAPLQDIAYGYDLSGNILRMQDVTPGCGVANNPDALYYEGTLRDRLRAGNALIRQFDYDPLYRLVSATGRESRNIASPRPWGDEQRDGYNSSNHGTPNQDNAPNLTALYWEEYRYDAAGNMLTLRHNRSVQRNGTVGWETAWSRHFGMDGRSPDQWQTENATHLTGDWVNPPSNRLTHVQDRVSGVPTPPTVAQSHFYDASGNMVRENTTRYFEWDHADRMKVFRVQTDRSKPSIYAIYLYDSSGQRVKKLVVMGNSYRTTTYLGEAFEHHAEYDQLDGSGKKENCSLHVMDDQSRIAIKRVGPAFADDGAAQHPVQYHPGDHLGSSGLVVSGTGDWINREEFFPYGETSFGSFSRKRYRFTGKERDEESGLNYHSARYYAPWLGRWISCDPKGALDSNNLCEYCRGNPICFSDRYGTQTSEASPQNIKFEDNEAMTITGRVHVSPQTDPLNKMQADGGVSEPIDASDPERALDTGNSTSNLDAKAKTFESIIACKGRCSSIPGLDYPVVNDKNSSPTLPTLLSTNTSSTTKKLPLQLFSDTHQFQVIGFQSKDTEVLTVSASVTEEYSFERRAKIYSGVGFRLEANILKFNNILEVFSENVGASVEVHHGLLKTTIGAGAGAGVQVSVPTKVGMQGKAGLSAGPSLVVTFIHGEDANNNGNSEWGIEAEWSEYMLGGRFEPSIVWNFLTTSIDQFQSSFIRSKGRYRPIKAK